MQYRKTYFSDGNFHFIPFGIPPSGINSENLLQKSLIPLEKEYVAKFFFCGFDTTI
jgi:hypothetical protein